MTDRTVIPIRPTIMTRALWSLSDLMAAGRVRIENLFNDTPDSIGVLTPFVIVDVTGYVDERADLLAALPGAAPLDWTGDFGTYREWRGDLLTMAIALHETLPASGPAGDVVVPSPSPVLVCTGADRGYEASCGEPGPHGTHLLGDTPVMDEPEDECECGDPSCPAVPAETTPPTPGDFIEQDLTRMTAAEWLMENAKPEPVALADVGGPVILRPAGPADAERIKAAGLVQGDAQHWADPDTAAAWRRYALARAREAFARGPRFGDSAAAFRAVNEWAGREMLTADDAATIAGELTAPEQPRGRRWSIRPHRGRHAPGASEHIAAAGALA